ncbi:capsular polysaccharide biosynthesis protein [Parasphingopyxis marina]|uniref:Capsular polysaccharide biosynthesis protein n=1 Tax=Parasphingopyxis marina TaxID=2761622 RepID=A0A842HYC2_9SPHN|nr:capsular polysaccharide biosynthesis protein [Parasphingopyxis marina]MBC2777433.1 capsular polysaccharide biosynthesis protein [Parasphingopyxis marina]
MTDAPHFRLSAQSLLVPGRGVAALPRLDAFLPEIGSVERRRSPSAATDAIAGWGYKPTAKHARALAEKRGLPYIALEDGFLRSIDLGEAGTPPLSLVADDLGIYYDARGPSRIETLLEDGGWQTPELLARAEAAMQRIAETGLGKTNAAPPFDPRTLPEKSRRRVLVIDQTLGDASIEGGLADTGRFAEMLETARKDEPDAEIIVRRHPAVAAGLKKGCIPARSLRGVTLVDEEARAADIIAKVDSVYCVTSLAGFEALIQGKDVRCFGMPFYAGWGATRDEIGCKRRTAKRSTVEIFAAAYLLYSRYVDPISGEPTTLEATIDRLLHWRMMADRNEGHFAAIGFTPWKRAAVRNILSGPRNSISFHRSVITARHKARATGGKILIWSGKEDAETRDALARASVPVWRMEDGFLRSRGLGSDFHLPASVVLDDRGIYYDRHTASRLETTLEHRALPPELTARAARLRESLVAAGISKYNVGDAPELTPVPGKETLLVVGQVEDDRSIERGTADIATNLGLLEAARADYPGAHLVYKPHPDVETGNRKGGIAEADLDRLADQVVRNANIDLCLGACDRLATMTSLAGFEALLRGKPVTTYGGPFYAGWGLTEDRLALDRRTRRLTLDELVAGTLLLYPRYIHPPTGLPCTAEEIVSWLSEDAPAPGHKRWRWLRALWASVSGKKPVLY